MNKGPYNSLLFLLYTLLPFTWEVSGEQGVETKAAEADIEDFAKMMGKYGQVGAADKHEKKITDAPSAVTVILHDEIQKFGYRTLADILRTVGGLHISYDRNYSFLGARGFNRGDFNSRMLVLINGHRMNNNIFDGARIDTSFPLDVDLIERVEIVRGPGSVLYGNNAFFGVINVVTRKGADIGNGQGHNAELSGGYGSFDTYRSRFTYSPGELIKLANKPVDLVLSGSLYGSQGQEKLFFPEFAAPETNLGFANKADADESRSFFGSLAWAGFKLDGGWFERDKHNPTAPVGSAFNDSRTRTTDQRHYVNLTFEHEFPKVVDLTTRVYYDEFNFGAFVPFDQPLPDVNQEQHGAWWGSEVILRKEIVEGRYEAILGAEYRDDFRQEILLQEIAPAATVLNAQQDRQSYSVYLQNDFTILPKKLSFNAGVRYDYFTTFGDTINPRLALIYHPLPDSSYRPTLKTIYGTAFRAPNVLEFVLSPQLAPETIDTYELVWEQEYGGPHLRSTVSLFYNEINDLISRQPGVGLRNVQGAETKGAEVSFLGFWLNGDLQTRLSYSYQQTTDRLTGERLTDSPQHLGKLNLSAPIYRSESRKTGSADVTRALFANLEFQYTSERLTLRGTEAPGFGLVNFTLFSRLRG